MWGKIALSAWCCACVGIGYAMARGQHLEDIAPVITITITTAEGGSCSMEEGAKHATIEGGMTWRQCAEMALQAILKKARRK